jgi:hypothetical protein
MIRINKVTGGRFGNRVLQYNSLLQLSDSLGVEASCCIWEGNSFFESIVDDTPPTKPQSFLNWNTVLHDDITQLPMDRDYHIDDPSYLLHNTFNHLTKKDPRDFLQIREEFKPVLDESKVNVGIHIRGDDIISSDGNNGREIHSPDYYKKAIDVVDLEFGDVVYHVCTDDVSFQTYIETIDYLRKKNHNFVVGDLSNHFKDFALLSECDVLICSSSTFVITAGFLGKPNKKIIHSLDWIRKHFDESYVMWGNYTEDYPESYWKSYDNFWLDLYNDTGSKYYKVWKLI